MSNLEEFLELQSEAKRLRKKCDQLEEELDLKNEKILELTREINTAQTAAIQNEGEVTRLKSNMEFLETERANLEKSKEQLEKENKSLSNRIDQFTEQLRKYAEMIEKNSVKLEEYYEERDKIQQEKFELNEKLNKEILKVTEEKSALEKEVNELKNKYKKLRRKYMESTDTVMGTSMELESLREEKSKLEEKNSALEEELETLQEKYNQVSEKVGHIESHAESEAEQTTEEPVAQVEHSQEVGDQVESLQEQNKSFQEKINNLVTELSVKDEKLNNLKQEYQAKITALEEQLASLGGETCIEEPKDEDLEEAPDSFKVTGTYSSISQFFLYLKQNLPETRRTLRLIVPTWEEFKKQGLDTVIDSLQMAVLKNIGTSFDLNTQSEEINTYKDKAYALTKLDGKNLYAFVIDRVKAGIAVAGEDGSVHGFYSKQENLVPILSQAVMSQFITGEKL